MRSEANKLIFRSRLLLAACFFCCCQPLGAQRPLAHYPFNNSPRDQSGNQNHGVISGNVQPVADRFGNPCGAYFFDGSTGYIRVPTSSSLESPRQSLSICAWYNIPYNNRDQQWLTTICKGEQSLELAGNPQYRLQVQQNSYNVVNACTPYTPSLSSTISMCTNLTACDNDFESHRFEQNSWHFYCLTYNGSEMKAYMDGQLVFSTPYSQMLERNNSPLYIGRDEPGSDEYFYGALDDIRIYDVALDVHQIQNLYNEKGTTQGASNAELPFPVNYQADATAQSCSARVNFTITPPVSPCGTAQLLQKEGLPPGSDFPVGRNKIVYEMSAGGGYKEVITFFVEVFDKIPPQVSQPSDMLITLAPDQSDHLLDYPMPDASDNCQIKQARVTRGPVPGTRVTEGVYEIFFSAEDMSGNERSVSWKIRVEKSPDPKPVAPTPPVTTTPVPVDTPVVVPVTPVSPTPAVPTPPADPPVDKDTLTMAYRPNNIVFLIDASSSMLQNNKFGILKKAVCNIIRKLRPIDRVSLFTYSDSVSLLVNNEAVLNKQRLIERIDSIRAFGGTEAEAAVERVYESVKRNYLPDANNDIYMATDGIFSLEKRQRKIIESSASNATSRITLNILAFGNSAQSLSDLRTYSDWGRGQFLYISSEEEATSLIFNQIKINSRK